MKHFSAIDVASDDRAFVSWDRLTAVRFLCGCTMYSTCQHSAERKCIELDEVYQGYLVHEHNCSLLYALPDSLNGVSVLLRHMAWMT